MSVLIVSSRFNADSKAAPLPLAANFNFFKLFSLLAIVPGIVTRVSTFPCSFSVKATTDASLSPIIFLKLSGIDLIIAAAASSDTPSRDLFIPTT